MVGLYVYLTLPVKHTNQKHIADVYLEQREKKERKEQKGEGKE